MTTRYLVAAALLFGPFGAIECSARFICPSTNVRVPIETLEVQLVRVGLLALRLIAAPDARLPGHSLAGRIQRRGLARS